VIAESIETMLFALRHRSSSSSRRCTSPTMRACSSVA
jgi:hypothetical protein